MSSRPSVMPGLVGFVLLAGLVVMVGPRVFSPGPPHGPHAAVAGDESMAGGTSEPASVEPRPLVAVLLEDHWAVEWRKLSASSAGSERELEQVQLLEMLAAHDPVRALAWAEAEADAGLRNEFFQAALRGWGGVNPEAALAWAQTQTCLDQGQAMAAVFHGAAHNPENACRFARQLSVQDPARTGDYGSYLVAALNRAGACDRAAAYAAESPETGRVDLLMAAYAGWGELEPLAALHAIGRLADPETKNLAFTAAVSRWVQRDAKAVAEYAWALPDGREKTFALSVALREWAAADMLAVATWLSRQDAAPELDLGAAVVAMLPDSQQLPQFATTVAENITDARLRPRVLATIVQQWATVDPVAARHYAENSPGLRPEDRAAVLAAFSADFSPVSLLP